MKIGLDTLIYGYLACIAGLVLIRHPHWLLCPMIVIPASGLLRNAPIPIGPVNVYAKDLVLGVYILAVIAFLFRKATSRSKILDVPDDTRSLVFLILAYISMHMAFMVLVFLQGIPLDSAIRRFLDYADCLYFFFPIFFLRDTRKLRNVMLFIACTSVLFPGWQIFMYVMSGGVHSQLTTNSGTLRLTGSHMIPILGCGIYILLLWGGKIRGYILTIFPLLSILVIGHRSGYLALTIGFLIFFFFTRKFRKGILYLYSGLFIIVASLIVVETFSGHSFIDDTLNRSADIFNVENRSSVGRFYAINHNFFVFKKKPITGIGYNHESLHKMFPPSTTAGQKRSVEDVHTVGVYNVLHPHNFVIRVLSHTGILGTLLICSIIFIILKRCYLFIRAGGMLKDSGVFLLCSIIFFLIMALMNTNFIMEGFILWILCGVSVLFSRNVVQDTK